MKTTNHVANRRISLLYTNFGGAERTSASEMKKNKNKFMLNKTAQCPKKN